jgi:hypothetical protein
MTASEMLSLLGSGIAAIGGLAAGYFSAYLKVKAENFATKEDFRESLKRQAETTAALETIKATINFRDTAATELRSSLRDFVSATSIACRSMMWLTWDAGVRGRLSHDLAKKYDLEMYEAIPKIISALAVIASLAPTLHASLSSIVTDILATDSDIGKAVVAYESEQASGLNRLLECQHRAIAIEAKIRKAVTGVATNRSLVATVEHA